MRPNLQHAIERVERPGGSHEGVGRKKDSLRWDVWDSWEFLTCLVEKFGGSINLGTESAEYYRVTRFHW